MMACTSVSGGRAPVDTCPVSGWSPGRGSWSIFTLQLYFCRAAHPDLASLTEQAQRLNGEVEPLQDLLRQHGIEPEDNTA